MAKYRNSDLALGRGICRCQIASNTLPPYDEKLYHFEILEDISRVQFLGVENFGSGNLGSFVNPAFQLNNYAAVEIAVENKLYLKDKTLNGLATFKVGSLILLRKNDGEFRISRIIEIGDNFILIEKSFDAQEVITIPEFENLTLDNFSSDKIIAMAVSDTLTIKNNLTAQNISPRYGNNQSWNKCNGIFILAKNLNFEENTRFNASSMIITENVSNFSENVFFTEGDNFIYRKI